MESSVPADVKPFKVIVGVDMSPMSKRVILSALALTNAASRGELHVVSVADYDRAALGLRDLGAAETPPNPTLLLQELATSAVNDFSARAGELHIQRVVTHLLVGAPAQEIVWLAAHEDADLIVVGTHGRKSLSRMFLGSVAERVVRTAGCPVHVTREKHHDAAWRVPEIEPPCPQCLAARDATGGKQLWCDRHQSHVYTHVYSGVDGSTGPARPWGFSV